MKKQINKYIRIIVSLSMIFAIACSAKTFTIAQENTAVDNGLEVSKTATKNDDGSYTVRLEAYTTGTVITTQKAKPTDIVLVLDQSGSMSDKIVKIPHYVEIYGNGSGMDSVSPNVTHYIQEPDTGKWLEVKKYKDVEMLFVDGKMIINQIYQDELGRLMVPLNKNNEKPISNYDSYQFHRVWHEELGSKKIDVLKTAVNRFVQNVVDDGGDHRIAMVGFASGAESTVIEPPFLNTELLIGDNQYNYNDPNTNAMYASAFQSVKTNKEDLFRSVSTLSAVGATRADLGMDMANRILAEEPLANDTNRNKVIIMFTDGEPNSGVKADSYPEYPDFQPSIANATINQALTSKQIHNAKVYTVGVVDDLDPSQNPALEKTNIMNRYMQYISSNFPNAKSLDAVGENGDYTKGNFLSATDEESLLKIFDKISEDIASSKVNLDSKTILKDIMSEYFKSPNISDIKTYTSACTGRVDGIFTWAKQAEINSLDVQLDANEITVTGFDYNANFVAINDTTNQPKGSKLIVEFKTSKVDGFLGGTNVPTNNQQSGIYVEDTLFEAFPQPTTNVGVEYNLPSMNDMGIYIGSKMDALTNLFDADNTKDGLQYIQNNQLYTIDGTLNAFVDITYTLTKDGEVIGKYTVLAGTTSGAWDESSIDVTSIREDIDIKIGVTVTAIEDTNNRITDTKNGTVYVYVPTIQTENRILFLGESVKLDDLVLDNIVWENTDPSAVYPITNEPVLEYSFKNNEMINDKDNYKPSNTGDIYVQVWNDGVDISKYAKINKINIQVVKGELSITKTMDQNYTKDLSINANQSFIFRIDRRDTIDGPIKETFYQTIDFSANVDVTSKTKTLINLSKGYYSVSEEADWSWKYSENQSLRLDNYDGNGNSASSTENQSLYIGERLTNNAKMFYGSSNGTFIANEDHGYPATAKISNFIKDTNILGDGASAKNTFSKDK